MASTKVSLSTSTWTQVSPAGVDEVTVFLPRTAHRIGLADTVAFLVATSTPAAGEHDEEVFLQNDRYQPQAFLRLGLGSGEELYARWVGRRNAPSADRFVVHL